MEKKSWKLTTISGNCQPFQEIKPTPTAILRLAKRLRRLPEQGSPTRSLSQKGREIQSI